MALEVQVVRGRDALNEVRDEWLSLLPSGRWAPFLHPDWTAALWDSNWPHARVSVHVARRDGVAVGVLPVCRRRMNQFGLFMPVTDALGGGRGDYSGLVVGDDPSPDVIGALIESALTESSGAFVIANMPKEEGWGDGIRSFLEQRGLKYVASDSTCLRVPFAETIEETRKGYSKSLRTDLRRQRKRLAEAKGELEFTVAGTVEEALSLLPALYDMHDRRWLEAGRPGTFSDPKARLFYQYLVERMWEKGLHFSYLRAGEEIVAFHLGLVGDGHLLYYKPTFDYTLNPFSPGKIHLDCLIEQGVEDGWKGLDMLQGDEKYKRSWSSDQTETETFTIQARRASPAYWWVTSGRWAVQRQVGGLYNRIVSRREAKRR